jgi:hypothetical protein
MLLTLPNSGAVNHLIKSRTSCHDGTAKFPDVHGRGVLGNNADWASFRTRGRAIGALVLTGFGVGRIFAALRSDQWAGRWIYIVITIIPLHSQDLPSSVCASLPWLGLTSMGASSH